MRNAKKLLGFAGLAAVALMTAIAYCLPAPEAAAQSTSNDVQINVTVRESHASVRLSAPKDNDITIENLLNVETEYTETTKIEYTLEHTDIDGKKQTYNLPAYIPTAEDGTHQFTVDLDTYGFGDYTLTATITGVGGVTFSDNVSFEYAAAIIEDLGTDKWGNPIIRIRTSNGVNRLEIKTYNKLGDPTFVDEKGQESPVVVTADDFDANRTAVVTLPMDKFGAAAGNYTGLVLSYTLAGQLISTQPFAFDYTPVLEVPNTGLTISDLNITKTDYLLTGLIMFASVAGFAIFLVARKSRC